MNFQRNRDKLSEIELLNVEANLQLQRNRDKLSEIDAVRKRANYTPRQLLDPDELALERAKARGNYTP